MEILVAVFWAVTTRGPKNALRLPATRDQATPAAEARVILAASEYSMNTLGQKLHGTVTHQELPPGWKL